MEGLAPPLKCLLNVKLQMEKGNSLRSSLQQYVQNHSGDFEDLLFQWLILVEQGQPVKEWLNGISSPYRRVLFQVFYRGLQGEPIFERLSELEEEILGACRDELERKLLTLPVISMIPLLIFQFPAFLLLLLGPLVSEFAKGLSS